MSHGQTGTAMTPESTTPGSPPVTAIVVAGDEETRVLLRGLLRLHHVQVVGEASGSTDGVELLSQRRPSVLIADANLAEGSCAGLLDGARRANPHIRVILLTPDRRRPVPNLGTSEPDVVLTRPFRIHEFANVLDPQPTRTPAAVPGPA